MAVSQAIGDDFGVLPEVILHQGCLQAFFRPAIRDMD